MRTREPQTADLIEIHRLPRRRRESAARPTSHSMILSYSPTTAKLIASKTTTFDLVPVPVL